MTLSNSFSNFILIVIGRNSSIGKIDDGLDELPLGQDGTKDT